MVIIAPNRLALTPEINCTTTQLPYTFELETKKYQGAQDHLCSAVRVIGTVADCHRWKFMGRGSTSIKIQYDFFCFKFILSVSSQRPTQHNDHLQPLLLFSGTKEQNLFL
jgi:hypothetical protein